jgi:hypothetical protein
MHQEIEYKNTAKPGPVVIVLPDQIKSTNATFTQKLTANNIADYAEIELSMANFKVLERADIGPLLDELSLAVNLGNVNTARKIFQKGRLKTTKWVIKFDVLKAEQVAKAERGFDLTPIAAMTAALVGGQEGEAIKAGGSSVHQEDTAGVWVIGLRYKILDANTTEQVATGYREQKIELGSISSGFLGLKRAKQTSFTLDSMVQRLVQQAVAEIDSKHK